MTGRRILVIKLGALGDFVQALGPFAAIRRHHAGDRITLPGVENPLAEDEILFVLTNPLQDAA